MKMENNYKLFLTKEEFKKVMSDNNQPSLTNDEKKMFTMLIGYGLEFNLESFINAVNYREEFCRIFLNKIHKSLIIDDEKNFKFDWKKYRPGVKTVEDERNHINSIDVAGSDFKLIPLINPLLDYAENELFVISVLAKVKEIQETWRLSANDFYDAVIEIASNSANKIKRKSTYEKAIKLISIIEKNKSFCIYYNEKLY